MFRGFDGRLLRRVRKQHKVVFIRLALVIARRKRRIDFTQPVARGYITCHSRHEITRCELRAIPAQVFDHRHAREVKVRHQSARHHAELGNLRGDHLLQAGIQLCRMHRPGTFVIFGAARID